MPVVRPRASCWNKNVNRRWGVTSSIATVIRQLEIAHIAPLLPDLHFGPTMVLTSDYGGQHKGAVYESFSFLVADLAYCELWNKERQRVRDAFFNDKRRISYKALNDRQRRNALLPFLAAADLIPGLLITVLVNKAYSNSYKLTFEEREELPSTISSWPSRLLVKMMFIAHLGALLIAGLSAPGQNVLWFTDNDDFVANDQRLIDLIPLFAGIANEYVGHQLGHFRFGTMKCDPGDLQIEDLASIADLVSGAACEIPLNVILRSRSEITIPLRDHVSPKALTILHWMGQRQAALKRLVLAVDIGDQPSSVRVRALDLYPD